MKIFVRCLPIVDVFLLNCVGFALYLALFMGAAGVFTIFRSRQYLHAIEGGQMPEAAPAAPGEGDDE